MASMLTFMTAMADSVPGRVLLPLPGPVLLVHLAVQHHDEDLLHLRNSNHRLLDGEHSRCQRLTPRNQRIMILTSSAAAAQEI
eukprot:558617-Rhodomonas_salina.3